MKLGFYLNAQHPQSDDAARRLAESLEQARLIRDLGFDSIWGGEHHVTDGYHYFPLLPFLQRLAAEADGLEIGSNIVLLPLHNPVEVAEIAAFMDVVTGGRFILGVGLGYRQEEFDMFGVPIGQRVSRMVEGIEIIRRLWTEDQVSHAGRHWQFDNLGIRPQPLTDPHPPILIGAQVEAAVQRAARIADGWCIVPTLQVQDVATQLDQFRRTRAEAGLAASRHLVRLFEVSCAETEEAALRRAAPFLVEKYASYASWGMPGLSLESGDAPETQLRKLARDRFGIGTPEQVVDALLEQHRIGVTHVTMRASWPGMSQEDILASIELIGKSVLPAVRARLSG